MQAPAARKATTGATSAGMITFSNSPAPRIASAPLAANAAPTTPPISACEELDGSPKYHVARFQTIAPINPAKITVVVIRSALTMPLAIVAATLIEMKAPTKFRIADRPTAVFGASARVEIDVATAFAVSWNPLVKSKASAVATTITRMTRSLSTSDEGGDQEFLVTMFAITFAMCSVASIASSRRSKMSFQRMTTIGSIPPSNRDATASRVTRSPSVSRRWISLV